jgi:uncharacterized protein YbbC (DUF1343 family)
MRTGLEVLIAQGFALLRGKRAGLITNHTGLARDGRRTADILAAAPGVKLVALFSPQHGPAGKLEDEDYVTSAVDPSTGVPLYSLFDRVDGSEVLRPSAAMLAGLDVLVFDIQDIGARFYTYITTLGYALEEAARAKIAFVVLDRPNPINGRDVQGPTLESKYASFIGYYRLPVRHGMTVGELARLFNAEKDLHADLNVVAMEGWKREHWFDDTGLPWVNPSPNMRSLSAATVYPGSSLLEGATNFSVGRGSDRPFEILGAPWLKEQECAGYLNDRYIRGVRFIPRRFTPTWSRCAGQECGALELLVTDREILDPVQMGIEIIAAVRKLHPKCLDLNSLMPLLGHQETARLLEAGEEPREIAAHWYPQLKAFHKRRQPHLLYS